MIRYDNPNADETKTPTHVRIFKDDEWWIDGSDDEGNFTDLSWHFDTHAEAVEHIAEFIRVAETCDNQWQWRGVGQAVDISEVPC